MPVAGVPAACDFLRSIRTASAAVAKALFEMLPNCFHWVWDCLVRGARASRMPAAASRRSLFLIVRWARRPMQHPGRARSLDLGPIPCPKDLFFEFTTLHPLKTTMSQTTDSPRI